MISLRAWLVPAVIVAAILVGSWLVNDQLATLIFHIAPFVLLAAVFAHFQFRTNRLSLDLENAEEAIDRLEPDRMHLKHRYRFSDQPDR